MAEYKAKVTMNVVVEVGVSAPSYDDAENAILDMDDTDLLDCGNVTLIIKDRDISEIEEI